MTLTAYRREIEKAAEAHHLDADLVEAVVLVESSGKTYAYRYEPAFFARYLAYDEDYAGKNPERVSASYGLMQVMFPVAVEVGYAFEDPEHLFVPSIGLAIGCEKLAQLLAWAKGDQTRALAAYNGGKVGNTAPPFRNQPYADKVLAALERVRAGHRGEVHG